jgi:hypothetical protein
MDVFSTDLPQGYVSSTESESESEWRESSAVKEQGFSWRFIVIVITNDCKGVFHKSNHPSKRRLLVMPINHDSTLKNSDFVINKFWTPRNKSTHFLNIPEY